MQAFAIASACMCVYTRRKSTCVFAYTVGVLYSYVANHSCTRVYSNIIIQY